MTCVRLRLEGRGRGHGASRCALQPAIVHKKDGVFDGPKQRRGMPDGLTKCCAKELCPERDRNSKKRTAVHTWELLLNPEIPCKLVDKRVTWIQKRMHDSTAILSEELSYKCNMCYAGI